MTKYKMYKEAGRTCVYKKLVYTLVTGSTFNTWERVAFFKNTRLAKQFIDEQEKSDDLQ